MTLRRERLRKLITAAFIFAVLFLIVAVLIETGHIAWFDDAVIPAVQGLENDGLTRVMKWFTFLGSSLMAVILSVLAFFFLMVVLKHRRELLMFLTAVGGSELWNLLLKYAIQRDRLQYAPVDRDYGLQFSERPFDGSLFAVRRVCFFGVEAHPFSCWKNRHDRGRGCVNAPDRHQPDLFGGSLPERRAWRIFGERRMADGFDSVVRKILEAFRKLAWKASLA